MQSSNLPDLPKQSLLPVHRAENDEVVALMSGRYVKKSLIGRGTYAQVFLARKMDESEAKYVALKEARKHGEIEIEVLKELNPHLNIVTMLDYSILDKTTIALELADCDVSKLVGLWGSDKMKLNSKQLNFFLAELLRGFVYIQKKGRVRNTDISEVNVLYFSTQNRLKITDFGVDWCIDQQRKVGVLLNYVLRRMSHNCTGIPGRSADFCDSYCKDRHEDPIVNFEKWKEELNDEQRLIIAGLLNSRFDLGQIEHFLGILENKLEILPKPSQLSVGEVLQR